VPHLPHTRCDSRGAPQSGQALTAAISAFLWALRILTRILDFFRFGTAIVISVGGWLEFGELADDSTNYARCQIRIDTHGIRFYFYSYAIVAAGCRIGWRFCCRLFGICYIKKAMCHTHKSCLTKQTMPMRNKTIGIAEFFDEVETVERHIGHTYSARDAIVIAVMGSVCGLKNLSQIH